MIKIIIIKRRKSQSHKVTNGFAPFPYLLYQGLPQYRRPFRMGGLVSLYTKKAPQLLIEIVFCHWHVD